ncbi:degenerin mec-10 [Trichonephila clavipes]|uniref:Degenerin mec-10 n=1 Tax=Trichonephila clavipes TaxID=2585209 RepID=A0A8X6WFY8_TRICX|nr:degenerin mec-10 [Trichonephila clavipes]
MKLLNILCKKNTTAKEALFKKNISNFLKNNSGNEKYVYFNIEERLQKSSIYAVSRIGDSKNIGVKLLWILILTVALSGCGFQTYRFVDLYFKYPIMVNYRLESQRNADFPAVTICNMNRMKSEFEICLSSNICVPNKPASGGLGGAITGTGPLVLPERRNYLSCTIQFKGNLHKPLGSAEKFLEKYSELSSGDRWRYGHQFDDLIKKCSFRGKSCEGFLSSFPNFQYGNCFTFNRFDGFSVTTEATTLLENSKGLELVLNSEINQYVPISHTAGFRIVIHDPSDEPNPEEKGMNIIPGYETNVLLRRTLTRRLPAPYKDHCVIYSNNKPFVGSQTLCMQACIQEYNYAKCGCTESSFITLSGRRQCNVKNSTDVCCLDSVLNHLSVHGTNCECPLPCVSTYYNEISTRSMWPSKASFIKVKANSTKHDWKTYRASYAKINIFFSTLDRTVYEQNPLFHESEIFSHLGGEFGLWLGFCQVIYSQFGLAIHQNDHQARRRFVEWAQNEIAVVPDFHKRILFSDEAHFWLNGYVNKQNCRIWSEANPQVYVETPLHPEKLTVWCALWAGGILLQKR